MEIIQAERPLDEAKLTQEDITQAVTDWIMKKQGRLVEGPLKISCMTGGAFYGSVKLAHPTTPYHG